MIPYMQQGSYDSSLLNREIHFIEIIQIYLQKLCDVDDFHRVQSVYKAFLVGIQAVNDKVEEKKYKNSGMMVMPLHRCFVFFLTKILMK